MWASLAPTRYRLEVAEAAEMLEEAHLRGQPKLMIGGCVTTPMVKEYIGADFQTLNAMDGVVYCMEVIGAN